VCVYCTVRNESLSKIRIKFSPQKVKNYSWFKQVFVMDFTQTLALMKLFHTDSKLHIDQRL